MRYFLVLIFLASSWSLFTPKFFRVHDYTQAGRIVEMTKALADGHFPVRWASDFGFGYGMPLFEFYGPLPFYTGAIFYWLGVDVVTVIKILYLLANAGTLLGAYWLGKKIFGRSGGLLTAAALTLAPYRALNLFVRGALNEAWAIMFLPWILLGVVKIFRQEKWGWLLMSLALTGLFLSHNITTMIFAPILVLFCLGYFLYLWISKDTLLFRRGQFRWRSFLRLVGQLIGSGLLAIGLSAFYLIPAFLEKGLTQVESVILTPYFNYHLHFLYIRQFFNPNWGYGGSGWGVADDISFFLGWGQWLSLAVLAFLLLKKVWWWLRKKKTIFPNQQAFIFTGIFTVLLGVSLYLTLLKSQWLWDKISLFEFIQFPWRFLSIASVFLALTIGSLVWLLKRKGVRLYASLFLTLIMILGSIWYFRPEKYLDNAHDFYYTEPVLIHHQLSDILPDYLPVGVPLPPSVIADQLIVNAADLPASQWEILADRTQEKLIQTSFEDNTLVSLAIADYPGWRLEIDDQRWGRQIGENGNIELVVPAGSHLITARFLSTPVRQYADWVSLAAWLLLIYLLLPVKPYQKQGQS